MSIETQYNQVGADYISEKRKFYGSAPDPATDFIVSHLRDASGKEMVDVGCGGGDELELYRSLGFKDAMGIDISDFMVAETQKIFGASSAQVGSWVSLPFPNQSKDYLIGRFSLHYVADLDAAYTEAARVLKPKGILLLVLPNPDLFTGEEERMQVPLFGGKVNVVYPRHTMAEFRSSLFDKLFETIEQKKLIDTQNTFDAFGVAARKR